jgi:hypothetical protein
MGRLEASDCVWITTLLLAVAAALTVAVAGPDDAAQNTWRDFQATVGGLGTGRAIDLSRCGGAFDLRSDPHCGLRHGPRPGSDALCPDHSAQPLEPR